MININDIKDIIYKDYTFYLITNNLVKEEHLFPYHYQEHFFDSNVSIKVMKDGIEKHISEKFNIETRCEVLCSAIYVLLKTERNDILLKYSEDNKLYVCIDLLDRRKLTLDKFNRDEYVDYNVETKEITYMGEEVSIKEEATRDFEILLNDTRKIIDL